MFTFCQKTTTNSIKIKKQARTEADIHSLATKFHTEDLNLLVQP